MIVFPVLLGCLLQGLQPAQCKAIISVKQYGERRPDM